LGGPACTDALPGRMTGTGANESPSARQYHYARAHPNAAIEVHHVFVGEPDAS
jgi:hypothetical protein